MQWKLEQALDTATLASSFIDQTGQDFRRFLAADGEQTEPTRRRDPFVERHGVYRFARAAFDLVMYDPDRHGEDAAEELLYPVSRAHDIALMRLLMHPLDKLHHLQMKLDICREETLHDGSVIAVLAEDARRVSEAQR